MNSTFEASLRISGYAPMGYPRGEEDAACRPKTRLEGSRLDRLAKPENPPEDLPSRSIRAQTATVLTAPKKKTSEDAEDKSRPGECSTTGGETILVVDDVDGVRELICEVLEMAGYEVLLARDGLDALQVAEDHDRPIDLLLTDVVMPHMGGQELAHNLSSRWPETKIIFMSGYSDEAISRQGVLKEGTAFIKKPFTADSLTRQIRRELDA